LNGETERRKKRGTSVGEILQSAIINTKTTAKKRKDERGGGARVQNGKKGIPLVDGRKTLIINRA